MPPHWHVSLALGCDSLPRKKDGLIGESIIEGITGYTAPNPTSLLSSSSDMILGTNDNLLGTWTGQILVTIYIYIYIYIKYLNSWHNGPLSIKICQLASSTFQNIGLNNHPVSIGMNCGQHENHIEI